MDCRMHQSRHFTIELNGYKKILFVHAGSHKSNLVGLPWSLSNRWKRFVLVVAGLGAAFQLQLYIIFVQKRKNKPG